MTLHSHVFLLFPAVVSLCDILGVHNHLGIEDGRILFLLLANSHPLAGSPYHTTSTNRGSYMLMHASAMTLAASPAHLFELLLMLGHRAA